MSEETKTPEGDYVMMERSGPTGGMVAPTIMGGDDDMGLSQEDKDHRLAIQLQQQENAAVYEEHKKRQEKMRKANDNRTARSGTFTRLANVRAKDQGMLTVPKEYTTENAYVAGGDEEYLPTLDKTEEEILKGATPQQIADYRLAKELQKVEQVGAGTARELGKIVNEESTEKNSQANRTERSNFHINQKLAENVLHR